MASLLLHLLGGVILLTIGLILAFLLGMQALAVGVFQGMGSCLWLCIGVTPTFLGLIATHELGHILAGKVAGLFWSLLCSCYRRSPWS